MKLLLEAFSFWSDAWFPTNFRSVWGKLWVIETNECFHWRSTKWVQSFTPVLLLLTRLSASMCRLSGQWCIAQKYLSPCHISPRPAQEMGWRAGAAREGKGPKYSTRVSESISHKENRDSDRFLRVNCSSVFQGIRPLSGSEGVSPFRLVIREEFSEAVVPSYQKKQWKEAFLPPQGHYFLDYPFILCWVYIKSTGQAYPECSVHRLPAMNTVWSSSTKFIYIFGLFL